MMWRKLLFRKEIYREKDSSCFIDVGDWLDFDVEDRIVGQYMQEFSALYFQGMYRTSGRTK